MRIATVANHLGSRGGLERTQMTTCRALASRGHRLDVVYASEGDFADQWRSFATTMVPMSGSLPRRGAPLRSTTGVLRALRDGARLTPDVLYVYRYWDLPYAAALSAVTGAPVVYHLCLPPPTRLPWWLRAALRRVNRTLSVSHDTARRWESTGLHGDHIDVVLTGVELDRYVPGPPGARADARRELGIGADAFVVLYAGRVGREKGVDILVRAFGEMSATLADAQLVVVGSPSLGADPGDSARYVDQLERLAAGLEVRFLPGRADVVPLLQTADVAVVPSLWPEPLSRALMEPLACGVPVVATDVGGNPEILTGWLEPFLVPAGDPKALAASLTSLYGWRTQQPDLGARCRRHAEDALGLERETDLVERALQDAAGSRRRRRTASATERGSCG